MVLCVLAMQWVTAHGRGLPFPRRAKSIASLAGQGSKIHVLNSLFVNQLHNNLSSSIETNITGGFNTSPSRLLCELQKKYGNKLLCLQLPDYPDVDAYLCGTLHVSIASVDMVQEVVREIMPNAVVIELCSNRIDSLVARRNEENMPRIKLRDVLSRSWKDRSIISFGTGLLMWMQGKAAQILDSNLGEEFAVAAKEAHGIGASVVLGDRNYDVTIQRAFDRLGFGEKIKATIIITWEVLTMSLSKMKEYISRSDSESDFVRDEVEKFSAHFPILSDIIIKERDEYLAQSILEVVRIYQKDIDQEKAFHSGDHGRAIRKKVVAVIGAGHMLGVKNLVVGGGVSVLRIQDISRSSKHQITTWSHNIPVLNTEYLFGKVTNVDIGK
jgi:pheromone shutdown protein TraB